YHPSTCHAGRESQIKPQGYPESGKPQHALMNEQEFKPGDLVRLKSGGPIMTYSGNDFAGRAICTWFHVAKHESYCKRDGVGLCGEA
ncbi:DUF2158 domain-containing protein, partial [Paracoccus fontiphilus]|uniref:DUF2158 domain-containing protein n=1 Tax=Paracoccus fontiphilus TaxID=1815556 RepID=UPI001A95FC09